MSFQPEPQPTDRILTPVIADAQSLQGYGWMIGLPAGVERDKIDFYGKEVRVTHPAEFRSNDDTCLNLVSFAPRPHTVRWMEYHSKHTQTFIPLAGKPFYMVLGKPTQRRPDGSFDATQLPMPNLDDVRCFRFDGSAGIVMHVGTWHEVPFPINGDTHFVCICTNETNDNLEHQDANGESSGGDLQKLRLERHFGFRLLIDTKLAS
jgi:ureidoglycolate lyase